MAAVYARADQRRLADEREEKLVVGKDRNWEKAHQSDGRSAGRDLDVIFERRGDAVAVEAAFDRDRGLSHQPQRPRRQPGDPAARTGSPFANGPAEPEGCAKRDRARYGRRDADRNPSERVGRRRGAGPGIDAPLEPAVFVSPPRDHPAPGRSAATPTSNANESARRFHQSIARRSPLARRTPGRSHPDHRVARHPRGQKRRRAELRPWQAARAQPLPPWEGNTSCTCCHCRRGRDQCVQVWPSWSMTLS